MPTHINEQVPESSSLVVQGRIKPSWADQLPEMIKAAEVDDTLLLPDSVRDIDVRAIGGIGVWFMKGLIYGSETLQIKLGGNVVDLSFGAELPLLTYTEQVAEATMQVYRKRDRINQEVRELKRIEKVAQTKLVWLFPEDAINVFHYYFPRDLF